MQTLTISATKIANAPLSQIKSNRVQSIDLLRGTVMIIMALDHVRDYFHYDAFFYQPTDLTKTSVILFFTRWITHYCAPVFVFLAGISAFLYGYTKTKKELALYLLSRGLWLVFAEIFLVTLGWTFNPTYPILNLQVIWAIGISMIVMSALIYLNKRLLLMIGVLLVAAHNLADSVHMQGNMMWALLHEGGDFRVGHFMIAIHYPVLPWIGIMAIGYSLGIVYTPACNSDQRRTILLSSGVAAIALFIILRVGNIYGDPNMWSSQRNMIFDVLSILNVTKYPPSLLYTLMTLGPALIFLGLAEKRLNRFTGKIALFGKVPFFYYLLHIYLIHLLALLIAHFSGYAWSAMILNDRVNRVPSLKGYGYSLWTVYLLWCCVVVLLYPLCKWYYGYKRSHSSQYRWLSYI